MQDKNHSNILGQDNFTGVFIYITFHTENAFFSIYTQKTVIQSEVYAQSRPDFTKPTKKWKSASGCIEYNIKKES